MVVQHHLSSQKMHTYKEGTDVHSCIIDAAMETESVLHCWEAIAHQDTHASYEQYSIELLKAVINLWVTVRAHVHLQKSGHYSLRRSYKKDVTAKGLEVIYTCVIDAYNIIVVMIVTFSL